LGCEDGTGKGQSVCQKKCPLRGWLHIDSPRAFSLAGKPPRNAKT
jgi:hypothetical protein